MRKDKSYMTKIGRSLSHGLFIAVLCLLLPSCTKDDDVLPDTGETCKATLRLNVSSFGSRGTDGISRSVAANSDEDLVKDLWVFQFSSTTGGLLKDPVYIPEEKLKGVDEIEIDFSQNGPQEHSIVCVVANTHDEYWATDEHGQIRNGFDTSDGLRAQALPAEVSKPVLSSNMGATGGLTIPMYGESAPTVIATKTYIRVPLVRMFARVHVMVDPSYPYAHHMSVKSITYFNVPRYSRVKEITEAREYPETVEWKEYVEEGANECTLYIPENRQGVDTSISDKLTTDPTLFPKNAFAVKVDLIHATIAEDPTGDGHIHEYTVYPGENMINDFNIKRNYIYNVNIKLISEPDKDTIIP